MCFEFNRVQVVHRGVQHEWCRGEVAFTRSINSGRIFRDDWLGLQTIVRVQGEAAFVKIT